MNAQCDHSTLSFASSQHASVCGFSRPTEQQRVAAATLQSTSKGKGKLKRATSDEDDFSRFCAPLVLPGDELSEDPEYPPQSLREWHTDEDRNAVQPGRRTIYVAAPPRVDSGVAFVESWSEPNHAERVSVEAPDIHDVIQYLEAFYDGMPVKLLPHSLSLTRWEGKPSKTPRYIGLQTPTECITRIRTRASRDGVFARQLNLDDLLDAAIDVVSELADSFALLLVVPFDLYEGPDDDFACGRAYGGSRVAVVSTARYHPGLDRHQGVDRLHAWPASHCKLYMDACCSEAESPDAQPSKNRKGKAAHPNAVEYAALSPLHAAVIAHNTLPSLEHSPSPAALSTLWLGRACRTASHELGHCLGMDHCVYFACAMQGTASLTEDARQPPFLCPVDLAKMLAATGAEREGRYRRILAFCEKREEGHLFAAFAAWIRALISEGAESESKRAKCR